MNFRHSNRLQAIPPYLFAEINELKAKVVKEGRSLISLAIGDPDQPTPEAIVEKMQEAIANPVNHPYSDYEGSKEFRNAVARWYDRRFGVSDLDPEKEIIALIGSKEGVAHFPIAFCNPGDKCLIPSPGYPVFASSAILAGATPIKLPHTAETQFLPDPNVVEKLFLLHRPRYLMLNYPSNPTTQLCPKQTLAEIVFLAKKHQVILCYDNAYSEIYYDTNEKPLSLLSVPGAKDIAIEFHSLSKTFNMTGWRLGTAVGNPELVQGLLKAKTHIDSGPLLAVQQAATFALENDETLSNPIRDLYKERRNLVLKHLDEMGFEYLPPKATFFIWIKTPGYLSSMDFTRKLIEKKGIVVTPGVGFGKEGEGFFRLALTANTPILEKAMKELRSL